MIASVSRRPAARRGAFTLLEVLVVVAILVILASVGTISVLRFLEGAKQDKARTDMQTLYKACKAYYVQTNGQWPQSLEELVTPPQGGRSFVEQGTEALVSPFNRQPYQLSYRQSPTSGEEEPVISLTTPDGQVLQWPQY